MKKYWNVIWTLLFLLALLPMGMVQAAEDPAMQLLRQAPSGVNYDPETRSWVFYGVPVEQVRYEMPGAGLDLVRVLFQTTQGGTDQVWITLGMQLTGTNVYLSRGEWQDAEHMQNHIHLRETLLKVYLSETRGRLRPIVEPAGIDWSNCITGTVCEYGRLFDDAHNDFSNRFIQSETAPGWYPWGFLFWDVEIANQSRSVASHNLFWSVPK